MDDIKKFINSHGYDFDVDLDGRFYEFDEKGKKGWYIGENKAGKIIFTFGDWRTGERFSTFVGYKGEADPEYQKQIKAASARKLAVQKSTAITAQKIWSESSLVGESQYLKTKGLSSPYGARFRPGPVGTDLIIPMYGENDQILNIQKIQGDGTKLFLPGGRVKGLMFVIPGLPENRQFYFCEGFATGATIAEATGEDVMICFSAAGLYEVAKNIKVGPFKSEKIYERSITFAADNDWDKERNYGLEAAQKASKEFVCNYTYPKFLEGEKGSDFNDLMKIGGIERVREDLKKNTVAVFKAEKDESKEISTQVIKPSHPYDTLSRFLLPDVGLKGKVHSTINNFETIMDHVGAVLRYNVIKKDEEWFIPGEEASQDNYKNVLFARILDLCARAHFPVGQIDSYLKYLCEQNQYNPVKNWVESKSWDGVSRLESLYATIEVGEEKENPEALRMKKLLIRKWMLSAIAAAMRPNGIAAPGILVLQGLQYLGKTRWFMSLAPKELGLLAEGKTLNPSDKDSVKQIVCYWMVELGELDATFRKSDIAALKAFLTRQEDMFRPAYARAECHYPRRTVFFGSVNHQEFLADETGNRRFWTLECVAINHDHGLDMQQIWAELYEAYKLGEKWWLQSEEMRDLNTSNQQFEITDPIKEKLLATYDWAADTGEWLTITEILSKVGFEKPDRSVIIRAGAIVRKLNGGRKKKVARAQLLWLGKARDEAPWKEKRAPGDGRMVF